MSNWRNHEGGRLSLFSDDQAKQDWHLWLTSYLRLRADLQQLESPAHIVAYSDESDFSALFRHAPKKFWAWTAGGAVAAMLCVGVYLHAMLTRIPAQMKTHLYTELKPFEVIYAPVRLIYPNGGEAKFHSGRFFVKRTVPACESLPEKKNSIKCSGIPQTHIYSDRVQAEFDFRGKLDFVAEGPQLQVDVVGTAFKIDWSIEHATISVSHGAVRVKQNSAGPESTEVIHTGQSFVFAQNQSCKFGYGKPCEWQARTRNNLKPLPGPTLFLHAILRLHSGEILDGVILREDRENLFLLTPAGNREIAKSAISDRVHKKHLIMPRN